MKRKASKPKARTKPTRQELLYAYAEWLHFERNMAMMEAHPERDDARNFTPVNCVSFGPHRADWKKHPASKRAAKVLKAVGAKVRLDSPFSAERVAAAKAKREAA